VPCDFKSDRPSTRMAIPQLLGFDAGIGPPAEGTSNPRNYPARAAVLKLCDRRQSLARITPPPRQAVPIGDLWQLREKALHP